MNPLGGDSQKDQHTRPFEVAQDGGKITTANTLVIRITIVASLGGFLFGFDTGVIGGALPYLRDGLLLTATTNRNSLALLQEAIVVSAIAGAAIGGLVGGFAADKSGRKRALFFADVLFIAGAICMALATAAAGVIVGRVAVGAGIGISSAVVPVYISEVSPADIRAKLVSYNVLAITFGQFIAYLSNFIFSFVPGTWRWMLGIGIVPAIVQLILSLPLPESPRWLLQQGKTQQAEESALLLGSVVDVYSAVDSSESLAHQQQQHGFGETVKQLVAVKKQLHVGIGLQVIQQLCGINTVMYYLPVILQISGIQNNRTALLASLIPAAVNAAGTVVGMMAIETYGRRKLLLSSTGAVFIALGVIGTVFKISAAHAPPIVDDGSSGGYQCPLPALSTCKDCLQAGCAFCGDHSSGICVPLNSDYKCSTEEFLVGCPSDTSYLILAGLVIYLMCFSPGLGPVPWAVVSEIFPTEVRATAAGVSATSNWIANAVVAQTFLTITQSFGASTAFWIYGIVAAVSFVWISVFLPETKGLSLDQVQQLF